MRCGARRWPRTAMMLVCLCALGNVRMVQRAMRHGWAPPPENAAGPFAARFEPLRAFLPGEGTVGFVLDEACGDRQTQHPEARFGLAQYALSPQLLERSTQRRLVIVDSDDPAARPAIANRQHWQLVADASNGVRLYRTTREE